MSQPLIPPTDKKFKISDYDTSHTGGMSREAAEVEIVSLRIRLNDLQDHFFADRGHALLVVLQAIDTGGKDGTIKSVFQEVGPLGCSVVNFGVPTALELAHDYLWRYHNETPERGKVVIFNRSYYEAVLVERVKGIVPDKVWRDRYEQMNGFERYLTGQGTVVMKFFLHISKEEQRERLQQRVDSPKKQWKFRMGDLDDRKLWEPYEAAFEDMVDKCNTDFAPWHVVPADKKWYRDVVVARALIERLEKLDLHYPEPEAGIKGLTIV